MITIHTANYDNCGLARLWNKSIKSTCGDMNKTSIYYNGDPPKCADQEKSWAEVGLNANGRPHFYTVLKVMPQEGIRLYIEDDMIPLRPWSVEEYPGNPGILCGAGRSPWYAFTVYRSGMARGMAAGYSRIIQTPCRERMPDWMPEPLRKLALDADSLIVGDHFLHVDRISAWWPRNPAKEALLDALCDWWEVPRIDHKDRVNPSVAAAEKIARKSGQVNKSVGDSVTKRIPIQERKSLVCVRRGVDPIGTTSCGTCGNPKATTSLYSCSKHGSCTVDRRAKDPESHEWCLTCDDFSTEKS